MRSWTTIDVSSSAGTIRPRTFWMQRPFSLPMAGLEYPGLLALQMAAMISGELWVVLYARKGQVYVQGFSGTHALTGIGVFSADRTREILAAREGAAVEKDD